MEVESSNSHLISLDSGSPARIALRSMAGRSAGMTKNSMSKSLIDKLIAEGFLKTPEIIAAFKRIKRENFVTPEYKDSSEADVPLTIGHGQTISQPATVAFMIERLQPQAGDKILDIGSGSGWTTALLAAITGGKGMVYAIERIAELKDFGEKNIDKYNFIKDGKVRIFCGDGYSGLPEFAPFDKILISAAAKKLPERLLKQLKPGGRLVIPLGGIDAVQDIVVIDKTKEEKFKETRYPGFVFVPLVKE